jgi:hypothetical protein
MGGQLRRRRLVSVEAVPRLTTPRRPRRADRDSDICAVKASACDARTCACDGRRRPWCDGWWIWGVLVTSRR